MRIINKDTDYAVVALCYIAGRGGDAIPVSELASELEISYAFLRKIFHTLQRKGIVYSRKGNGGGFTLARDPEGIYVSDIMEIFQGPVRLGNCKIGDKVCHNADECVLRRKLISIGRRVYLELKGLTIGSLIGAGAKK